MVTDGTGMLHNIYLTALVISYSIFPPIRENAGYNRKATADPAKPGISVYSKSIITVKSDNVRFYLADLNRAINPQGELRLLFSGCLALAAPLLLFRLKRDGFSDCRALMTPEGVLLSAIR